MKDLKPATLILVSLVINLGPLRPSCFYKVEDSFMIVLSKFKTNREVPTFSEKMKITLSSVFLTYHEALGVR